MLVVAVTAAFMSARAPGQDGSGRGGRILGVRAVVPMTKPMEVMTGAFAQKHRPHQDQQAYGYERDQEHK
jgi:hypothetical protein